MYYMYIYIALNIYIYMGKRRFVDGAPVPSIPIHEFEHFKSSIISIYVMSCGLESFASLNQR